MAPIYFSKLYVVPRNLYGVDILHDCEINIRNYGSLPLDYELLVLAAKKYHVDLEVNNNTFRRKQKRLNYIENYKTMLKLCMEYGSPVIVSSDAHGPSLVGEFQEAWELLEQVGFDGKLILNTDTFFKVFFFLFSYLIDI